MTHEDSGHYAAKHPDTVSVDPRIPDALKAGLKDGTVSCAAIHGIAADLGLSPSEVGVAADLAEVVIVKCQLGLFGYAPEKKVVKAAASVDPELEEAIRRQLVNDRLPCSAAWEIARRRGISKMDLSAACEALGVKVKPCQIGAF